MEVVKNFKDYRKYIPDYESWRDEQELRRTKRVEYLKRHPEKMNAEDIERGKILLHSIDVMDEYSQANAEDMEVATDFAKGQVVGITSTIGTMGALALVNVKSIKKLMQKTAGNNTKMFVLMNFIPSVIGMFVGLAASFPAIVYATKVKISASRKGRFEAMNEDLKNPAIFAVLTPEQRQKAEEASKNIKLEDREKKRLNKVKSMNMNPVESFRTLKKYFKDDKIYLERKTAFNKKLKENEYKEGTPLTDKQIRDAKRDQQILADMVRRIDIASQDYAENAELATNTLTTLAVGTGGLTGWASAKLLSLLKIKSGKLASGIPWVVGAAIPLAMGIYAAQIQKHASRIGRFNIKQEMLNHPEQLVYVDDKELDSITDIKTVPKHKKPDLFKFIPKLFKDSKAYNKYMKTEGLQTLKRNKAIENIKLSDEQLKNAQALQTNVFKTFNKVDENSQTYSESVEAVGEMVKQVVAVFGSLAASVFSLRQTLKHADSADAATTKGIVKTILRSVAPLALVILPVIGIDIYTTKAQKKASRIADMLALKELQDYKNYANYPAS